MSDNQQYLKQKFLAFLEAAYDGGTDGMSAQQYLDQEGSFMAGAQAAFIAIFDSGEGVDPQSLHDELTAFGDNIVQRYIEAGLDPGYEKSDPSKPAG